MNGIFSDKAGLALDVAREIAWKFGHRHIGTEHLLLSLTCGRDTVAYELLKARKVNKDNVTAAINDILTASAEKHGISEITPSPRLMRVLEISEKEAARTKNERIGTEHLLLAILLEGEGTAVHILDGLGILPQDLLADIVDVLETSESGFDDDAVDDAQYDCRDIPGLSSFGKDMTDMAKAELYDPVIGREAQIDRIIQILARRTRNNPIILGEPGVGKTAIVEGIAQQISCGSCPGILKGRRIFSLDVASLVAGAKYRGEFEDRLKKALDEIARDRDTILFIDEIHTIVGAGNAEGSVDASSIIKSYLSRGDIQIIGAATVGDYRKYIEKDNALERRLQTVYIYEPTQEETFRILQGIRKKYEDHHSVEIPDDTLKEAIDLSIRYISDRRLPDKAIDLIDEAAAMVKLGGMKNENGDSLCADRLDELKKIKDDAAENRDFKLIAQVREEEKKIKLSMVKSRRTDPGNIRNARKVTKNDIATVVSLWTGIPSVKITKKDTEKLMELETELTKRIVGQEQAVSAVSQAIRRNRVGLRDPGRPVGSFIFLGPTGVGKTELTKALAACLFDNENEMIRLDMSEYMEKHSVSKLIGSPPGYVGYDDAGQLTEKVKRKPYSIILFDEIEKAHPDVFNILLQVLEDGILTDSHGQRTDFRNTVIVMTSNIGARRMTDLKSLGFAISDDTVYKYEDMKRNVLEELKDTFRPEFLNRVDDVIVFRPLDIKDIEKIAGMMLDRIRERVASGGLVLTFDDNVKEYFARHGYDPKYGARPLRRKITEMLENRIAEKILRGEFKTIDRIYVKTGADDELFFQKLDVD
jgi:ATP-dependent Clp protease ATP-binding subunit ClpC